MQRWGSKNFKVRARKKGGAAKGPVVDPEAIGERVGKAFQIQKGFRAEFSLSVETLRAILEALADGQTEVTFSMDSQGKVRYQSK